MPKKNSVPLGFTVITIGIAIGITLELTIAAVTIGESMYEYTKHWI